MADEPATTETDTTATPEEAVITSAQAQAIATREAAQAARKAKREAAEEFTQELGIPLADAKALIEKARSAEEAAKDEATKARDEAAAARQEAERIKAEAKAELLAAKVERKLTAAGVPETALTRAVRMVALDPDADDDAIEAEIEALKGDVPALFATDSNSTSAPAPGVPPAKPPANGGGTRVTGIEAGREMARQRAAANPTNDPFARFKPAGAA